MSSGKRTKVQARGVSMHDQESGVTQQHVQSIVSQQEIVLPDAEELARYQQLDPDIVTWLMTHAAKEQDFRHASHMRKLTIREQNAVSDRKLSGWGMACAFVIFMSGMGLSVLLIEQGHNIYGSVFAGIILLGAVSLFITRAGADKVKPGTALVASASTDS